MADEPDTLVMRRSRRSTAGNRMEAALAEMALDDLTKDVDDDDFVAVKDEDDIFESDFESTDDEAIQEDTEVGDKAAQEEEKNAKKAARARINKATAAAHARQKVTFNPQVQTRVTSPPISAETKPKRRVSLGAVVNAETGEVIEGRKRQSQRRHTILNTSATVNRIKKSEAKKAAATPRRNKIEYRAPTQDELIAWALDNEEGNIVEHRDYLMLEEEKRKRARVVRATVHGPLLRWMSRKEEVKVPVTQTTNLMPTSSSGHPYSYEVVSGLGQSSSAYPTSAPHPQAQTQETGQPASSTFTHTQAPSSYPPLTQVQRTEIVTKNYVVYEQSQSESGGKPPWNDTMEALFGDHVDWEDMKVFTGKTRPLSRPKQICPITGKIAPYIDPRTGVPYADIRAYQTLTRILAHEYVWSESLGCYVSHEE